jgi:hypothetical protein
MPTIGCQHVQNSGKLTRERAKTNGPASLSGDTARQMSGLQRADVYNMSDRLFSPVAPSGAAGPGVAIWSVPFLS